MLTHSLLEASAARSPESIAVIDVRRAVNYGELDRLANRFANLLATYGVQRGDRVVIALENSIEWVGAYFGTQKAGAVPVPLPGGQRSDRLAHAIEDAQPSAALLDAAAARDLAPTHPAAKVRTLFVTSRKPLADTNTPRAVHLEPALDAASDAPVDIRCIDQDLAAIIYTSGSTGEPRGVMLTHRNLVSNARSIVDYLALSNADRVMCVLPLYYVYGLSLLHTHVAVGGSLVLDNRFIFPNVVLQAMRDLHVTGFAGVPSTFALLLHKSNLDAIDLPSLRYVTQAGGGMPLTQIRQWLERGPRVPFFVMYGATEASARLAFLEPDRLADKTGSIGRPIPNVEILVLLDDGAVAQVGEVGELVARGSNVSRGYWNHPGETAARFGPQGYRTGDLGYRDDDGYFYLVGRRHDMIKVGGNRVGAREIEDVLHAFPGVFEAAVVPAPHAILGEVPCAFVALAGGAAVAPADILAFCRERLAPYKIPEQIIVTRELPKIAGVGKIDRLALRAEAARHMQGPPAAGGVRA